MRKIESSFPFHLPNWLAFVILLLQLYLKVLLDDNPLSQGFFSKQRICFFFFFFLWCDNHLRLPCWRLVRKVIHFHTEDWIISLETPQCLKITKCQIWLQTKFIYTFSAFQSSIFHCQICWYQKVCWIDSLDKVIALQNWFVADSFWYLAKLIQLCKV